ncbi:hypothetical protein Aau02nite_66930 [Amorphoplanes auranticolor]|uniref:Uncharacterized protein n=1 Tax=Actinoplanes auranticolor TaxID=47988 RepID=A0A919SNV7_9ACTN|nr:hypothetical protein Aau02nite_66930 [Actinoplanes auranticolor]
MSCPDPRRGDDLGYDSRPARALRQPLQLPRPGRLPDHRRAHHPLAQWLAENPGRGLRRPGYGRAPAEIIGMVLAGLTAGHGSVHRYATERLQLDDSVVAPCIPGFLCLRESILKRS